MRYLRYAVLAILLAVLAACQQAVGPDLMQNGQEIVITEGVAAPAAVAAEPALNPLSTLESAAVSLGGSSTTPVSINGDACSTFPAQRVIITYTLSGNQASPASFKVNTKWDYNGTTFVGSMPTTVTLPVKSGGGSVQYQVNVSVENSSETGSGATSFVVAPFDLVTNTSDSPGQRLSLAANSSATIHVAFNDCTPSNTAPSITVPTDMTAEATSSLGALVDFVVSAQDAEDGDLTNNVICKVGTQPVTSGSTFEIGETTVNCSVTDSGGLSAQGSFKVTVQDTTPPKFTSIPSGTINRVATNSSGWTFSKAALDIEAADVGGVSEPVTINCTPADGAVFAIGTTTVVSCTATDARKNESAASTFNVHVTLDLSGVEGFLPPLRMSAPYSAHKRGSVAPHKVPAPKYADGSLATDLAGQLRLVLNAHKADGSVDTSDITAESNAASTAWRYDATARHYIFNLATNNLTAGTDYNTTVSIGTTQLAQTKFGVRR